MALEPQEPTSQSPPESTSSVAQTIPMKGSEAPAGETVIDVLPTGGETTERLTLTIATEGATAAFTTTVTIPANEGPQETTYNVVNASQPDDGSGGNGLSPAEAGGIAAGAALGGIIITLVVVFACHYRRKPRRGSKTEISHPAARGTRARDQFGVLDHLPQRIAGDVYRQKLEELRTGIKNCVDNFFHTPQITVDGPAEERLQSLAGPPAGGSSWAKILSDDVTQPRVVRALIAQILFRSIDPRYRTETCLLPEEVLIVYEHLKTSQTSVRRADTRRTALSSQQELMKLWRQVTGHLFPPESMSENHQLKTDVIASALAVFNPAPQGNFRRVLQGLVRNASQLALDLFASPDEWEPTWQRRNDNRVRGIVVFPGVDLVRKGTGPGEHEAHASVVIPLTAAVVER